MEGPDGQTLSRKGKDAGGSPVKSGLLRWTVAAAKRSGVLYRMFDVLARSGSTGKAAARLQSALQRRIQPHLNPEEVLKVIDLLERRGVWSCLAGGWGVDALVGIATGFHSDVDIVVEDVDSVLPTLTDILRPLGYKPGSMYNGGLWMPKVAPFEDPPGRILEFMSVDWERIGAGAPAIPAEQLATSRTLATIGQLSGRPVRCLSREVQLAFHSGYELRPKDHDALRRLLRDGVEATSTAASQEEAAAGPRCGVAAQAVSQQDLPWPADDDKASRRGDSVDSERPNCDKPTTLVVPLEATDRPISSVLRCLSGSRNGLPLHISILYPFLPVTAIGDAEKKTIAQLVGGLQSFSVSFKEIRWFGKDVVWLYPEPSEPLRDLTLAIAHSFPSCQPYEGEFSEVIPHLTVLERKPLAWMHAVAVLARAQLPFTAKARAVWLMNEATTGKWHKLWSFSLGSAPDDGTT